MIRRYSGPRTLRPGCTSPRRRDEVGHRLDHHALAAGGDQLVPPCRRRDDPVDSCRRRAAGRRDRSGSAPRAGRRSEMPVVRPVLERPPSWPAPGTARPGHRRVHRSASSTAGRGGERLGIRTARYRRAARRRRARMRSAAQRIRSRPAAPYERPHRPRRTGRAAVPRPSRSTARSRRRAAATRCRARRTARLSAAAA